MLSWEAAGAIGEIIGATAVVVSLIYLASQIRTQNPEARAASVHQVMHEYSKAISRLHEPEMAEIWVCAHEDFDSLSPSQRLRFVIYLMVAIRSFEDAYFQCREARLEALQRTPTSGSISKLVLSWQVNHESFRVLWRPGRRR